jgi:tripartite-type tricarboxylate transporter receptor subunit TctC
MRQIVLAGLFAVGLAAAAKAEDYPSRAITMVIPFAAGGPTDVLGRVVADRMSQLLGQQVVVRTWAVPAA